MIRPQRCRSRPAAILIVALVTLLVASSLVLSMIKRALDDRRQLRLEHDLQQVVLLVDAGLRRAEIRLAADSAYDGEIWDIPAAELRGHGDARVVIAVTPESDDEASDDVPLLRITAEYPFGSATSIRRTRDVTIRPDSALNEP